MSFDNLFWGGKTEGATQVDNHSQWRIQAENLLTDRDIWNPTAAKYFPLGAIAESRGGKKWRYCENGAGVLAVALVNQSSLVVTDWELKAVVPATVLGQKSVTLNVALSTALAAGDLIDGYLLVEDASGEGHMYTIKDHTIGTTPTIHLADAGGIRTVWVSATTEITLTKNKWKDVIIFPTDPTGTCVGVNMTAVPANYFFWSQTRGPCPIKSPAGTDTIVVGDIVTAGGITEGCASLNDGAVEGDVIIGYAMQAAATASDYCLVDLTID